MPFSIRGVSRERKGKMLTELRCDKWFFSTTLNLKARSSSSFYSPNHVRAFRLRLKNPVYTLFFRPLCVFVARPFFRPFFFFFCEGLSKSFKNSPGQVYFCCLPSQKEKRGSLFRRCRRMLTSHFVGHREREPQTTQPWVMSFLERVQQRGVFVLFLSCETRAA